MAKGEQQQPDWWKQVNFEKSQDGIVAHTPDPTKYHNTDELLQRGIKAAPHATMLPRARGWKSRGFNHNKANNRVVVDPDKPGGGFVIDPTQLTSELVNQAINQTVGAIEGGEEGRDGIFAVMQQLAQNTKPSVKPVAQKPVSPPAGTSTITKQAVDKSNPAMPGAYVVPRSDSNGRQLTAAGPVLDMTAASPVREPDPVPATTADVLAHVHTAAPQQVPMSQSTMEQLVAQQIQKIFNDMQARTVIDPPPVAAPPPPMPAVAVEPPARLTGIDYLDAATAVRPARTVVFDFGAKLGVFSTHFHDVIRGDDCIVLVYDTRYKDGTQYVPPQGRLKLMLRETGKKEVVNVLSMNLNFTLGCLDIIVLPLDPEAVPVPPPQQPSRHEPVDDDGE